MKLWDVSGEGRGGFWKVQLDVKGLGGHLDFTVRARAGTLSKRVREATFGVAAVGASPLGFQVKLRLVRGKYLPAGLHAAEASYVSSSSTSAFRAAIVPALWSSKMPLAVAPALLNLLDVGVVPDVKRQLYADNLTCSAERPRALFESARFTAQYVRSVGQDVSPGECVLLRTSKSVRKSMKLWDFTFRAWAGTLSKRVGKATVGLLLLVLYLWVFKSNSGWFVRGVGLILLSTLFGLGFA